MRDSRREVTSEMERIVSHQVGSRSGRLRLGRGLCLGLLLVAAVTDAREGGTDRTQVSSFSGQFETSVPIGVPSFRGLEPKLSLDYGSSRGNGFVGVGWGLAGQSTIERAGAGKGAPRYDSSDIFLLNGLELVSCAGDISSASCDSAIAAFGSDAGFYATRIESYVRIKYDGGTNAWTVWQRDGTTSTYAPLLELPPGTFRWGLSTVQDPTGNAVNYAYWCDGTNECYLDTITYNGTQVRLWREARQDVVTYATGGALATMSYRLKTVDVLTSGQPVRSYKLTYAAAGSPTTGRSLLRAVYQLGTDRQLDGAGTVAVPAGCYDVNNVPLRPADPSCGLPPPTYTATSGSILSTDAGQDWGSYAAGGRWWTGDFNGDGRVDLMYRDSNGVYWVRLSTGTALGPATQWTSFGSGEIWIDQFGGENLWLADFDGDGRTDLMYIGPSLAPRYYRVKLSTGTGFTAAQNWAAHGDYYNWYAGRLRIADIDGDGKADFFHPVLAKVGELYNRVWLSTGTSFTNAFNVLGVEFNHYGWGGNMWARDMDGDGQADILYLSGDQTRWMVKRGSATAFGIEEDWGPAAARAQGTIGGVSQYLMWVDDFNGDGKPDIMYVSTTTPKHYMVMLNNGNSFAPAVSWHADVGKYSWNFFWVADVNGDGRADLVLLSSGNTNWQVMLSTGTSFGEPQTWHAYEGISGLADASPKVWLSDFSGDGAPDLLFVTSATPQTYKLIANQTVPDLLTSIATPLGGSTTIAYRSSSDWPATYLPTSPPTDYPDFFRPLAMVFPTVSSVTMNDGRGDVQATTYTYSGALWNAPDREFLGFRTATTTLAATGAYSETYYWQRAGTIAKPEAIYKKRADGAVMSFETFRFTENATPPYTSLATEIWAYECNGHGVFDGNGNYVSGCRRVATTYVWDEYANITTENQYGDYDVAGDERTAVRSFAPNLSAYIVGLPAWEHLYAGLGTSGPLMSRTRFYYDGATSEATAPTVGALTKKSQWHDQTGGYVSHTYGYDTYGNQTSLTDPLGRTGTKEYDPTYHAYVTATVNSLGHRVESGYDYVLGQVTSKRDASGNLTTYLYNALGQPTEVHGPDGSVTKYEYLDYGNAGQQRIRQSVWTGTAWVWEDNYFDGLGREYRKVAQNGVTAETVYGPTGKPWKQRLPYVAGETVREDVYTYDELGRELTLTHPDGAVIQRSYGNDFVTTTDAMGHPRTAWADAFGRIVKVREVVAGQNQDTTFEYDVLGRRTRAVDAAGNVTTATYDSLGRTLQKSDPDVGLWRYAYDDAGQLTAETDALSRTTTLAHDALGRVTRRTYAGGAYDSYTFDEAGHGSSVGRVTTTVSASGVTTTASYDSQGRRTAYRQLIDGTWYTISHAYDVTGRMVRATYPDGEVVTYGYGTSGLAQGRLTSVSGKVTGIGYNARGQMTSLTYANGVTTSFGLDGPAERIAQLQFGSLATINYGYDLGGRVTSMTSAQLGLTSWSYAYDELGRLRTATNAAESGVSQKFSYDGVGRMVCNSKKGNYGYGAAHPHAVTSAGADTYAYDANGNMTAGAGRSYVYDLDHKPSSITAGGLTTSFVYDAQGARVKKSSSQGTVIYVGSLYEQRGSAVTKYYYAGALRVAKQDADGASYFHSDHLGSTRLITDAAGQAVKRYEYAPFGKLLAEAGTRPDSHRFTGQEADDETGLMFYAARYYDPALGRFVQPDPFLPNPHNPQDLDVYAYAYNSPINFVDPSGHAPVAAAMAVAAAYVAAHATAFAIAAVVIGTALTYTNNPWLQTIGMVMAGVGGAFLAGPLLGLSMNSTMAVSGAVALAQSPVSPLDPTVKKAIGWAYTMWGGVTNIANGMEAAGGALNSALVSGGKEVAKTALALGVAYAAAKWGGTAGRYAFAFLGRYMVMGGYLGTTPESWGWLGDIRLGGTWPGALSMVGASYDLAYSLKYPDGQVVDLSGGAGGDKFTFYAHPGYESPLGLGRQHIRVGDGSGYWEIGDFSNGHFGPGLGWGGWVSTRKVTVIMSPMQAAAFRGALAKAASGNSGYVMFSRDSYTYISSCLQFATGKTAADLHINAGLLNWK